MPIFFDRGVCCDLNETAGREWLITNGKGGYAAGTVAGMLTRLQQGLLVASPQEGAGAQLLVAKMDEEVVFDQRTYYLGTNEYRDGTLNPVGYVYLETFRLEEGFPVFRYHLGGIDGMMLEKRIWMPRGLDTTYIQYRLVRTTGEPGSSRAGRAAYTRVHEAQGALSLALLPFVEYRESSEAQHGRLDWQFAVETLHFELDESIAGCRISAHEGARRYAIFGVGHVDSESTFLPTGVWYWNVLHRAEQAAGHSPTSDLYLPGVFRTKLWPGEDVSFTIILTAEDVSRLTFSTRYLRRAYEEAVDEQRGILQGQRYFGEGGATVATRSILPLAEREEGLPQAEEFLRLLFQAADRLVAERPVSGVEAWRSFAHVLPESTHTPGIVSGFYGGQEKTRDSLIALPGLLLATGRYAEARRILARLGRYFYRGLLPDRLHWSGKREGGNEGEKGREGESGRGESGRDESRPYSADTGLWYFYALDAYMRATGDDELLESLGDVLVECIEWYRRGTLNGIGMDARDGLMQARWTGKALTWMDGMDAPMAGGSGTERTPVTPRMGKPVEINALWYHALSLMQEWAGRFSVRYRAGEYEELRQRCWRSFNERFWSASGGYLYDVIDGDGGDDSSIRPNQLFALSLRHGVLDEEYRRPVLKVVTEHLLTPCGLRTLSPGDERYRGRIGQHEEEEQRSVHQGGAWPWLMGPYMDALLRVEGEDAGTSGRDESRPSSGEESRKEREHVWRRGIGLLEGFREQLRRDMLGAIGTVYDGDAPQELHVHLASALSTGEIVRVYQLLAHMGVRFFRQTVSVR